MNDLVYSDCMIQWLELSGHRHYQESSSSLVIDGGETRYYLRMAGSGLQLTSSDRNDIQIFIMEAGSVIDIERYLTCSFGFVIRSRRKYPAIYVPLGIEDLKPGWTVDQIPSKEEQLQDPHGHIRGAYDPKVHAQLQPGWSVVTSPFTDWLLWDPTGTLRARFDDSHAVRFSWIADASLEALQASYLDPDGLPLFPNGWTGPPGKQPHYARQAWQKYHEHQKHRNSMT